MINGAGAAVAADPAADPAISFLTDHTATVNNAVNVTGAVQNNTGTNGLGTLSLSGANVITGNIGASGAALKNVNVTATNVTINGDVYVSAFSGLYHGGAYTTNLNGNLYGNSDIGNGATLNLGSGYNLTGHTWSGIGGVGTLNINGDTTWTTTNTTRATRNLDFINFNNAGIVTLGVNLDADDIRFRNTTQTTLVSDVALTARNATGNTAMAVQNTASIDVGDNTLAVTGTVNFGANTTLKSNTTGQITSTGNATVNADTNVYVTVGNGSSAAHGDTITLINGTGGLNVATLNAGKITTNSAVLSFTQDVANQADLVVQASRTSYNAAAGVTLPQQGFNGGDVLNVLAYNGAASGDMAAVTSTLDGYSGPQLREEINRLAPVSPTAVVEPTFQATILSQRTIAERMDSVRGNGPSGVSTGDAPQDRAVWIKGFGSYNRQDQNDGFDGYTARTGGLAAGADKDIDGKRVGVAFSYGRTAVEVEDTRPQDETDIDSYKLALYGSKEYGPAYIDAQIAYSLHNYDGTRQAALNRVASASYHGHEFSSVISAGYAFVHNNLALTPYAAVAVSHLSQDNYTEKGAGALNLRVDGNDTTRVKSSLGGRISTAAHVQNTIFTPEIHAAWDHDFGDVSTDATSRFSGGGANFVTPGQDIARNSYNLGTGVSFMADDSTQITATYDYETRSDFEGHNLQIKARLAF